MKANSIVIVTLHSPKEKIWGQLLDLTAAGVTVRGVDVNAFDDWLSQLGSEDPMGMATIFYPLYRIERIALDEPVGSIPSLTMTFQDKTGLSLIDYLSHSTDVKGRS